MGNLIRFDSRRRVIPGQEPPKGEGEVLIFTGVRYERAGNGASSNPTRKITGQPDRPKRKRS